MVEKSSDLRRTCDATHAVTFFVAAQQTVEKCLPLLKEISYDEGILFRGEYVFHENLLYIHIYIYIAPTPRCRQ